MGVKETKKPFSARRKQYFYRGIMNAKRYFTKLQLFLAHAILRTSKKAPKSILDFSAHYCYCGKSDKANIISASQTKSPSTVALTLALAIAPLIRVISASSKSWSPGTT